MIYSGTVIVENATPYNFVDTLTLILTNLRRLLAGPADMSIPHGSAFLVDELGKLFATGKYPQLTVFRHPYSVDTHSVKTRISIALTILALRGFVQINTDTEDPNKFGNLILNRTINSRAGELLQHTSLHYRIATKALAEIARELYTAAEEWSRRCTSERT